MNYTLSEWRTRLERVTGKTGQRSGDEWRFPCPVHDGVGFNFAIVERNGKILTTCHSHGCPHEAVRSALGLDAPEPCAVEHRYEYRRADGELHLTVHMKRDAVTGKKSGRPWREPRGVKGPQPLYRLPELLEAGRTQPVLVVEGEHTCDAARAAWPREPVVTWAGGCKSWRKTDWKPLRGRRVTVAADADSQGRDAARAIATHLHDMGCDVALVLPEGESGDDLADWLGDGRDAANAHMQELRRPYEPGEAPGPTATLATRSTEDRLDINQLGAIIRDKDAGQWAYTAGRGWFRCLTGGLWRRDPQELALRARVQELIDLGLAKSGTRARLVVETMEPAFAVDSDRWDADPHLAGLPNGRALDLRTGEIINAGDTFITRQLPVLPERGGPIAWLNFLDETFSLTGEADRVVAWLRWWLRRSLSGDCRDESLVFLFGPRGTGKSTIAETWQHVVGKYAATVPGERFTSQRGTHRQWLANLEGARVVIVDELPERGRWQTPDLNALVSGESITANFMRQGDFTFRSQAHMIVVGNHRPRVSAQSGFWRRLRLLECRHAPSVPDDRLKEKLRGEAGRILQWVLDGPEAQPIKPVGMDANARTYMEEADHLAAWLNECVELDGNAFETAEALRSSYEAWSNREGIDPPMRPRTLGMKLTERFGAGFDKKVSGRTVKCRAGVRLRKVAVAEGCG